MSTLQILITKYCDDYMRIILGSQSKSKKDILQKAGYDFEILPPNIDEKKIRSNDPKQLSLALAAAKTSALLPKISGEALLITSDQVVLFNDAIRGKPRSGQEARVFLETAHEYPGETFTAVEVTNTATGQRAAGLDVAKVYFKKIPPLVISHYLAEGDLFSHAGGFAVENPLLYPYVDRIEGSIDSIRGLPMDLTQALIEEVAK